MSVKVCRLGCGNAPPTFQRLMQNCLGELNLTYCLIYLDDVIVFSDMPDEHLRRMRVVFDRLREHGLKLKPSKCEVFKIGDQLPGSSCEPERCSPFEEKPRVDRSVSTPGYLH